MFGTLHYNAGRNETQYVERSDGVAEHGGNTIAHFACDNCRAKKLKCDGQKLGCFRCKGSSTRCLYTRYSNKRERQRRHDISQRTKSFNKILCQDQTSRSQRAPSEGEVQAKAVSNGTGEGSHHPMDDDRMLPYEKAGEGNISSPDIMQELGVQDENLLFNQFLPDLLSDFSPQDVDPFTLESSRSNTDGTMSETIDTSSSHEVPCLEPTSSSPRLPPIPTSFNSIESFTPHRPSDLENPTTCLTYQPDKSTPFSEPETESPIDSGSRTLCQCPQAMVTLLDELDESGSMCHQVGIRNMHIIIAQVKNALRHCNQIVYCNHCSLLSDHMMLAAVVLNKLVSIMEEVSRIYIQRRTWSGDSDHQKNSWNLSIGDYAVDLEVEWAAVMKVLLVILLERTLGMLDCLKRIARAGLHQTQVLMLLATEQKAKKAALNMQSGEALGHGSQSIG